MNAITFWLIVAPLALASALYIAQAVGYSVVLSRPGMSLAFLGYVIANVGFVADALGWRL